jgi:hypothetical protein
MMAALGCWIATPFIPQPRHRLIPRHLTGLHLAGQGIGDGVDRLHHGAQPVDPPADHFGMQLLQREQPQQPRGQGGDADQQGQLVPNPQGRDHRRASSPIFGG